jgi:hypothetical protein
VTGDPERSPGPTPAPAAEPIAAGRYVAYHAGRECGEERWRIVAGAAGLIATGEHLLEPPHPFPNRQEWRATLTADWRVTGLEIFWSVGERRLHAVHGARGDRWHARFEYGGQTREQQGDYPDFCEVDYVSPLFNTFYLARRDFGLDGEHEFPVLRIGPPWMAVSPERMLVRHVERGRIETASGPVDARRYVVSLLGSAPDAGGGRPGEEVGYTFWADERGIVLASYEGPEPSEPWMKLVECTAQPLGGLHVGA